MSEYPLNKNTMNIINKPISPSSTKTCSSSSFSQMNQSPADYKVDIPPAMEAPAVIMSPCAACKILRRRCVEKCVLAPYFPPTDPLKFTIAHRVFGASNIIKFLQELPESQRADAVSSMVYEANARVREPVYGCAGVIFQLQKQVSELQAELAKSQAEIVNLQCQQSNLLALLCMDFSQPHNNHQSITSSSDDLQQQPYDNLNFFQDHDVDLSSIMEPLWT